MLQQLQCRCKVNVQAVTSRATVALSANDDDWHILTCKRRASALLSIYAPLGLRCINPSSLSSLGGRAKNTDTLKHRQFVEAESQQQR